VTRSTIASCGCWTVYGLMFVDSGSLLVECLGRLGAQGHGTVVVLSSVAAERARAGNAIYGAPKAGRAPMAITPDAVAAARVRTLDSGAHTVWVPGRLRLVFSVLRHLPRSIYRKLPL
jgi:decaprenylphospho-beta-D-erythro-pentofuranosid-2-ulose 2-reductase